MSRRLKKIRLGSDRALLSDTLPFEVPITFSNHGMYQFLSKNRVDVRNDEIVWKKKSVAEDLLVKMLFGLPLTDRVDVFDKSIGEKKSRFCKVEIKEDAFSSNPYNFFIKHKEDSFRKLSVPHPISQCRMVNFYKEYAQSILYYCNQSSISIRKPSKVSTKIYYDDFLYAKRQEHISSGAEQLGMEYPSLRSFFVYRKYNNIYKFYESYEFHRAEKQFNKLLKLDVSKCFDSIYTHSIAWAIFGKDNVKRQFLGSENSSIKASFPDRLDRVMQSANGRETNGILIGPEFSRVFAEIIFQSIDARLLRALQDRDPTIKHGRDFKIFRYIDDYFVFFNDDSTREDVVRELAAELSEYKLHLNEEKAKLYEKPLITEITIAKDAIAKLYSETFQVTKSDPIGNQELFLKFDSRSAITQIKAIVKTSNVSYRDIQNWTLALLEARLSRALKLCAKNDLVSAAKLQLPEYLSSVLEFLFFVYSVSPRVNTTIRLCRVITIALRGSELAGLGANAMHALKRQIFEDVNHLLRKSRHKDFTQVETMYLVLQVAELGKQFQFTESDLRYFFGLKDNEGIGVRRLDYFAITTIFFYLKDRKEFKVLRKILSDEVVRRIEEYSSNDQLRWNTESVLLLFDMLGCPYMPRALKNRALKAVGVSTQYSRNLIMKIDHQWFTRWTNFDFSKQLDAKKSLEVY